MEDSKQSKIKQRIQWEDIAKIDDIRAVMSVEANRGYYDSVEAMSTVLEQVAIDVVKRLNSFEFWQNPHEYMNRWVERRGKTEKIRPVEDKAQEVMHVYCRSLFGKNPPKVMHTIDINSSSEE